ncbi:MAG: class I SAM-dependent methyltransferase [Halobacteriales archaeon]
MPITDPFEEHTDRYEEWFEAHDAAYASELSAVRELLPEGGRGLEIGVGSGRFAGPLDVDVGVDPAPTMLAYARERGVQVAVGVAEDLPFRDASFDAALIVTTICFVDDVPSTLEEARRVLAPDGRLVIGYVDRESPLGQHYQEMREENPFYRDATFHSTEELESAVRAAGFDDIAFRQTIFEIPGEMTAPEESREGYGEGSFVVIAGTPT